MSPKYAPAAIAPNTLERVLSKIRTRCVEHNLAAAIGRSAIWIAQAIRESQIAGLNENCASIWDDDVKLKGGLSGFAYEVVLKVLEHLSTKRSSASDDFWCWDEKPEFTKTSSHVNAWPIDLPRLFQATHGCVLVRAQDLSTPKTMQLKDQQMPDHCVFLLENTANFGARLDHVIEMALQTWAIHRSRRRDTPNSDISERNISEDFFTAFGTESFQIREQIEAATMLYE